MFSKVIGHVFLYIVIQKLYSNETQIYVKRNEHRINVDIINIMQFNTHITDYINRCEVIIMYWTDAVMGKCVKIQMCIQ